MNIEDLRELGLFGGLTDGQLAELATAGTEVPIVFEDRRAGKSKMSSHIFSFLK